MARNRRTDIQDYNDAREGLINAGLAPADRDEWIARTGQDPHDPSTWNRTAVDVIRDRQKQR